MSKIIKFYQCNPLCKNYNQPCIDQEDLCVYAVRSCSKNFNTWECSLPLLGDFTIQKQYFIYNNSYTIINNSIVIL
jgi:hypothetical protein